MATPEMSTAAIAATWWAGLGLVVGANRARTYPGPQDGLTWAALWAAVWPLLWLTEEHRS